MNTWAEWLERVSHGDSTRATAAKTVFSASSLSAWKRRGNPPADAVIAIARAYNADAISGLVNAGILTPDDVWLGVRSRLELVPTSYLTDEIDRRAEAGGWDVEGDWESMLT